MSIKFARVRALAADRDDVRQERALRIVLSCARDDRSFGIPCRVIVSRRRAGVLLSKAGRGRLDVRRKDAASP